MNEYREAKCIELHSANVVMAADNYAYWDNFVLGRHDDIEDLSDWSVSLKNLINLGEIFGPDGVKNKHIQAFDLPIMKNIHEVTSTLSKVKLECRIVSDRMLDIRITAIYNEDEPAETQEITYCGDFTVYW